LKIRRLDLDDQSISQPHVEMGLPPAEYDITHASDHPLLRIASYLVVAVLTALVFYFVYRLFLDGNGRSGTEIVGEALRDPMFWSAVGVGLLAQVIDGALGMAYGVTSTSFLLAAGASPAMASGATHLAEVFTTGVSGVSHLKMGNVNKKLFFSLLIPGVIGGLIGTYVLSSIDGNVLKPFISAYLLLMGLYVLSKAFRHIRARREISSRKVVPLALFGSFMDTTGGGGWGPIVTSTLVARGSSARKTIGTVNAAEFFVTLAQTITFSVFLTLTNWQVVIGLMIGGLLAAPLAAVVTKRLDPKKLMLAVGVFIIALSVRTIYLSFR
jgi:hypothetical protein